MSDMKIARINPNKLFSMLAKNKFDEYYLEYILQKFLIIRIMHNLFAFCNKTFVSIFFYHHLLFKQGNVNPPNV